MKNRGVSALLIALCLSGAGLAGCGGDSDTVTENVEKGQEKAAEVKPCDLITKADAEAAFGGPLKDGEADTVPIPSCVFASASSDVKSAADTVQIQVQAEYVFDGTKKATTQGTTTDNMFKIESVSGIGDDAFYQITTSPGADSAHLTLLGFKKKGVAIYVSVSRHDYDLDKVKTVEKQLAEKAADRL